MAKLFNGLKSEQPLDTFISQIIYKEGEPQSSAYLVKLSCYYDCDAGKPARTQNELILIDENGYWYWENDWYEGQANVVIYAIYGIDEIDLQDNI